MLSKNTHVYTFLMPSSLSLTVSLCTCIFIRRSYTNSIQGDFLTATLRVGRVQVESITRSAVQIVHFEGRRVIWGYVGSHLVHNIFWLIKSGYLLSPTWKVGTTFRIHLLICHYSNILRVGTLYYMQFMCKIFGSKSIWLWRGNYKVNFKNSTGFLK